MVVVEISYNIIFLYTYDSIKNWSIFQKLIGKKYLINHISQNFIKILLYFCDIFCSNNSPVYSVSSTTI